MKALGTIRSLRDQSRRLRISILLVIGHLALGAGAVACSGRSTASALDAQTVPTAAIGARHTSATAPSSDPRLSEVGAVARDDAAEIESRYRTAERDLFGAGFCTTPPSDSVNATCTGRAEPITSVQRAITVQSATGPGPSCARLPGQDTKKVVNC